MGDSLEFYIYIYISMSATNSESFTSSPVCLPCFCFLPTCSAYIFQYYVERSGESGHPCVVPNLRGEASSISTEYDVSCKLIKFLNAYNKLRLELHYW